MKLSNPDEKDKKPSKPDSKTEELEGKENDPRKKTLSSPPLSYWVVREDALPGEAEVVVEEFL